MDTTISIGRTIARERRRRGVTQEELAAHLSVSKAAVSKWELEQSLPDVSLLPRIAAYFSLTLDELFDWRNELTEEESATLYVEVCALAEQDLVAAHERLRMLATEHYSDMNLLLMLASLLTVWGAGMTTSFTPVPEQDSARRNMPDADTLTDEALVLIEHVLETATDPSTLFLAQQQRATVLFQAGRFDETASVLEPLVRRQDASAPTMLLASAYRKLGRNDDALKLLQIERLRATHFVLSSLMQEMGMRDDVAFARAAGSAAQTVFEALDMDVVNPFFSTTISLELSEALRRAGEKDEALKALVRVIDTVIETQTAPSPSDSPFWDCIADNFDSSRVGEAWAEHKVHQANDIAALMRQTLVERLLSSERRKLAGDDPRYQEIVEMIAHLSDTNSY